jgi:hypothetical protein
MKTSIFQNSNKNIVRISALNFFIASRGLPEDLVSNIVKKEAYIMQEVPKSFQEAIKTFRAEILTIFLLLFWKINVLINSFNWPTGMLEDEF